MFLLSILNPFVLLTVVTLILVPTIESVLQTIKIGGLFDNNDPIEATAFLHAIERLNADPNAFPVYNLEPISETVRTGDSYHSSLKICDILRAGVGAILGPQTAITASHVQSVCDVFNIPRLETKWDFRRAMGNFLINLFPHPKTLSMAYADVIREWGWSRVAILYENNESLVRLQGIFELTTEVIKEYIVRQLPIGEDEFDFRPLMKDLRRNYNGVTNIIVDCQFKKLQKLFEDANSENMVTHDHSYFVTSLDIHLLDANNDAFGHVNVTGLRLVDPANPKLNAVLNSWCLRSNKNPLQCRDDPFQSNFQWNPYSERAYPNLTNDMLTVDTALIYDAVELFALGLLQSVQVEQVYTPESISCDADPIYPWSQGAYLMNMLKQVHFEGLSGDIRIDADGKRTNFKLEVVELTQHNFSKIGDWSPMLPNRLNWTRAANQTLLLHIKELEGRTLNITTKESLPYVMFFENGTAEGFVVDVIDALAKKYLFKYRFYKVVDNKMGSPDNTTMYKWNGMIEDILSGKAQLATGDFSITRERAEVIDFTMPFMNIGISILYKKPVKSTPSLFSFLAPFHYEVWIYLATAYLGVSLTVFIIARLTPYEWLNPHPCIDDPEELELTLHLVNSLWFTIGTLMQQGSDVAPKAGSTRVVAGIWWFFTLILISSYTANLAAFLTSEGMAPGIKDIKDLPKQIKVKYGTQRLGSTFDFFEKSKFPLYAEIGRNMQSMSPPPYVEDAKRGVEKVNKSNGEFVFFMESASIEYQTERDCTLVQLGLPLDSKGYGIGFRKGSKFRDAFNIKLLEMQQKMELEGFKKKWWVEKGGGQCKTETVATTGATPLTLANVGGVFVVLLGGCIAAIIMVVFEFMWKARKLARDDESSIWSEIWAELKFAFQFSNEFKKIKKSQSINPTISESVPYLGFNGEPITED